MPSATKQPQTLYDKVFNDHIVNQQDDGTVLLYIGMSGLESAYTDSLLTRIQTDILSTK